MQAPPELPPQVYLVDKPPGVSSRKAALQLATQLGEQTAGHAGTLDPLAEGLLIVGVGRGTKFLRQFVDLPKTYEALVHLGRSTTTDDLEGAVEEVADACFLSRERVEKELQAMVGVLSLPVPRWSAVRVRGKRLYRLARKDIQVDPPVRLMEVQEARLLFFAESQEDAPLCALHALIRWKVGSGTYIRSLAHEFGRRLGVPASLCGLRRTAIGPFLLEDPRVWRIPA